MTEKIVSVWESNDKNQQHLARVNDDISSLAAVSEEISSSMAEMEAQAERIEEQCMSLKDDTSQMRDTIRDMEQVTAPIAGIEKTLQKSQKNIKAFDFLLCGFFFLGGSFQQQNTCRYQHHTGYLPRTHNLLQKNHAE